MDAEGDTVNAAIIAQLSSLVNNFRSIEKIYTPPSSIIREFVGISRP